jgi:ABC-2 type transport system permease protein
MKKQYIAFCTILRKEVTRFFRIWQQAFIPPIITSALYFIIFGEVLGRKIGDVDNNSYLTFIVPGLVIMQVILSSYTNSVFSFFSEKFSRSIEEIVKSSTETSTLLLGYIIASVLRGLLSGTLVLIVALFFTKISFYNISMMLVIAILSATLFSLMGLINGIHAKTWDDVSWATSFVITPMSYLGGVFYSTKTLSPLWQKISLLNPIFYLVDSFRYATIGIYSLNPYLTLTITIVLILAIWTVTVRTFTKFSQR